MDQVVAKALQAPDAPKAGIIDAEFQLKPYAATLTSSARG